MTTTTSQPATGALVPVSEPLFSVAERQALAGFLSGYSGLTRDAYTLDLRQYTAWCTMEQPPQSGEQIIDATPSRPAGARSGHADRPDRTMQ